MKEENADVVTQALFTNQEAKDLKESAKEHAMLPVLDFDHEERRLSDGTEREEKRLRRAH